MYKLNESLENVSFEVGRTRAFPRGWLENESIWVHMEYKYLLALLACGNYDRFFMDFAAMAIPFLPPETYGRSTLRQHGGVYLYLELDAVRESSLWIG